MSRLISLGMAGLICLACLILAALGGDSGIYIQ